ncbi:hypothetical protein [Saccharothrix syringae]|uniref:Uncharacterized protein n=1 Tax=Saccharothrix syringae TaxID=103733 RepID=A0A5Q0HC16_SACSY|nr:hypothetical protein [Saccharothrix syringae]QFZ23709.1 hypothetical protein EKG83_45340 [Saccharothrix syringae]
MKALKACAAVLAAGALLVGCGDEWSGELRLKVVRVVDPNNGSPTRVAMELDGDQPDAPHTGTYGADLDRLPEGVAVGDVVVCTVTKTDENGLDGVDPEYRVGPCRAA